MLGDNLEVRDDITVIQGADVTFLIIPTMTTLFGKHMKLTDKKAVKRQYDALLVKTRLQTLKLTWVNDASKRQHDLIVQAVANGEIRSISDLNERISQSVTYYGFAPVHLIPARVEHYL